MNPIPDIPPEEPAAIRAAIEAFLQERLQPKLDKLKDDQDAERETLRQDYRPEHWIPDAARRVEQIQQVTHALKYSHPDARGTSLNSPGNPAAGPLRVGTHTLNGQVAPDVVCNAADLVIYKFLRIEVHGRTLLERALAADPALAAALPGDPVQVRDWVAAFARLADSEVAPTSHHLAKQLYWPLADGSYHLLAPLFPTGLVHRVWTQIRDDRFSEAAKTARDARRKDQAHPEGFREYPDLAVRKFGGTKPQNISQLNSERHGENYLLAAVPPNWHSEPVRPPLKTESIFPRGFGRRPRVLGLVKELSSFLVGVRDRNNLAIREHRAELVGLIRDELIQFAAGIQDLPAGWSGDPDCRLNPEERFWLDPRRSSTDPDFARARLATEWQDLVSRRFGNWLNARLTNRRTPMGGAEFQAWRQEMEDELRLLREELDDA